MSLPAKFHPAKSCNKYYIALSQVHFCYKLVSTLGFHPEALPTSELHPGPHQHTKEDLGRASSHLFVLELQDQTSVT